MPAVSLIHCSIIISAGFMIRKGTISSWDIKAEAWQPWILGVFMKKFMSPCDNPVISQRAEIICMSVKIFVTPSVAPVGKDQISNISISPFQHNTERAIPGLGNAGNPSPVSGHI